MKNQMERGAIGVILSDDGQYLVIERAATVRAAGMLCFPGGAIEQGESEEQAVMRELQEELRLPVRPVCRLWQSQSAAQLELFWWLVAPVDPGFSPQANPAEVARWFWMSDHTMASHPKTLPTNLAFLAAVRNGTITIPRC